MGVPSEITCSVQRVILPKRVLHHRGLRNGDLLLRYLLLSYPGQLMAEGAAWPRVQLQIQQGTGSHAGTQLPARVPPTHSGCSDGERVGCSTVPLGNPRTMKPHHQPGATFYTWFLPLRIGSLPVVFLRMASSTRGLAQCEWRWREKGISSQHFL